MIKAIYRESPVAAYKGNPFIEALPPEMSVQRVREGLVGRIELNLKDLYADGRQRSHMISSLSDDFFQPLSAHIKLEEKLSIMIRRGYVGRNLRDGSLNTHMQNGYERLMDGNLESFRFEHATSTALSMLLIGCSGSGKSTTLKRILSTYPQVLFHENDNLMQVVYLKIDCPHDGSLKSLCIHFFRALDKVLCTNYETRYVQKRYGIETLLSLMSQVANLHAIGVLIIDEVQHLSRKKSGGVDKMLNFFVTLVNTIGLPVVFVGTPKARPIFENDLRSARRGAGFGSLLWEPMENIVSINPTTGKKRRTEWTAFTDVLWKYQWLQKRDELLSDEVRECWYDLSQGVLDIVVKLFILAQLRAIATRLERITPKLLRLVYDEDFKPVHPMLAALRSKDPEKIAQYSDLTLPGIDKKMLELSAVIENLLGNKDSPQSIYEGNEQAERLHNLLLGMGCDERLVISLVKRAVTQYPDFSVRKLIPTVLGWYEGSIGEIGKSKPKKIKSVPQKDWNTLDSEDLRFTFSQVGENGMYEKLKKDTLIFDVDSWLCKVI